MRKLRKTQFSSQTDQNVSFRAGMRWSRYANAHS